MGLSREPIQCHVFHCQIQRVICVMVLLVIDVIDNRRQSLFRKAQNPVFSLPKKSPMCIFFIDVM
jgi:hypothetical protein